MFAYKANAMIDGDEEGRTSGQIDVFSRAAVADHCGIVVMQFLEREWPCSSERLEVMHDFDPRMIESRRGVLFPFSPGMIERVRRVKVHRIV